MGIVASSSRWLDDTRASLLAALPPGGRELVGLVGVSGYLSCATVAARERAAGRLVVPDEKAARLLGLLGEMGVSCRRARFRMVSLPSPVQGTDHHGSFVEGDVEGSRAVLYFGLTPAFAEGAEEAELHGDHEMVGRLFGYPPCCARAFAEGAGADLDRFPSTIASTGPFPKAMNPVIPYVYGAVRFLFHFPCSPACEASLDLLSSRQRYLEHIAPAAAALRDLGAGIALYGPRLGIGLITRHDDLGDDSYLAREVVTGSARTMALFSSEERAVVRLRGPHAVDIGGRPFDDPNQFAARFA